MSEEKIRPLSMLTFGPLSVMVFEKPATPDAPADLNKIYVQIARGNSRHIPLIEVPALIEVLKQIATPGISITNYDPPEPPEPKG